MSDLIDKAHQIVKKAIEWDLAQEGIYPDGHGGFAMPGSVGVSPAFDIPGQPPPPPSNPAQPMIDKVTARYADVPGLFEPFTWCPRGGDFRTMSAGMLPTLQKLSSGQLDADPVTHTPVVPNPNLDNVATVATDVDNWHGAAASNFVRNHQAHFRTVAESQFIAAAVLKGCLEAEDAMWGEVAKNIEQIADRTLSALDKMDDTGKNGFVFGLTVVAAVVATVVVLPAGVALTAVAAAGSAATIAAGAIDLEFSGESAPVVVDHMREAIAKLRQQIVDTETKIQRAAREMGDQVADAPVNQFHLNRPLLAAEPGGLGPDEG
ncbi:MAG: hypothetical protein WB797_10155 [Nocardioides sp.]